MPSNKAKESESFVDLIRHVSTDEELSSAIKNANPNRLIVVYFSLPWCGSCQKMNHVVDKLASKYDEVIFVQGNADKLPVSAKKHHITKVPLFLLFVNRTKVDRVEGLSPSELESKIRRNLPEVHLHQQSFMQPPPPQPFIGTTRPVRMADLSSYMDRSQCRCVNDLLPTPFQAFLEGKRLVSGKGVGRMILVYAFKEKMAIVGFKIRAPVHSAPKVMRFFVNIQKVLDFAVISQMSSAQEIILNEEDITGDHIIELPSGGLVGVENLQIYLPENMMKGKKTEIESLTLIGAPITATQYANMDSYALTTSNSSNPIARDRDREPAQPMHDRDRRRPAISESSEYLYAAESEAIQKAGHSRRKVDHRDRAYD